MWERAPPGFHLTTPHTSPAFWQCTKVSTLFLILGCDVNFLFPWYHSLPPPFLYHPSSQRSRSAHCWSIQAWRMSHTQSCIELCISPQQDFICYIRIFCWVDCKLIKRDSAPFSLDPSAYWSDWQMVELSTYLYNDWILAQQWVAFSWIFTHTYGHTRFSI